MKGKSRRSGVGSRLYSIAEYDEETVTEIEHIITVKQAERSAILDMTVQDISAFKEDSYNTMARPRFLNPLDFATVLGQVNYVEKQTSKTSLFLSSRKGNLDAVKAVFPEFFPRGLTLPESCDESDYCRPRQTMEQLFARDQNYHTSKETTSCHKNRHCDLERTKPTSVLK